MTQRGDATVDAIGGIDEAGRGPLAGPVVAAVVVLRREQLIPGVRDSKQLPPGRRARLAPVIRAAALDWGIGLATPREIDEINILEATFLAMARAVAALRHSPVLLEVDGNRVPSLPRFGGRLVPVVGGDRSRPAIAAASILAKVWRDDVLVALDQEFPGYGFGRHKGYPTAEHRERLEALGPCAAHRLSFGPVRAALSRRGRGNP